MMPLPKPTDNETKSGFINRCMADPVMTREFKDASQRRGICEAEWQGETRMSTSKHPEYLTMIATPTIEATADGDDNQLPRFSMVAYTGGTMRIDGFPHPVVVDLAGLEIPTQNLPIRLDHQRRQGVGHTRRVAVEDGKLIAEGLISRETSWARDVARSGVNGFPWQASIAAAVVEAELVRRGRRVEVNGQTFAGPVHIVRRSVLKEISFVDTGADQGASAKVAARLQEDSDGKAKDKEQETMDGKDARTVEPPDKEGTDAPAQDGGTEAADPVAEIRAKSAAESRRIAAIRQICDGKHPDIEAKAIEDGWDQTRCELEVLRADRPRAPAVGAARPQQLSRNVLLATACMAGQMGEQDLLTACGEQAVHEADRYRGVGVQDFFRLIAGSEGRELPRCVGTGSEFIEAAFSTLSLPGILSNAANKMLLEGYNYVEDAWRKICHIASVNDFKQHTRYRLTDDLRFEPVGPDGELKHGQLGEQVFSQKADTHGILFSLTRQAIINDDLGAFMDIPRRIGMGAAEAIAEAVWTLLLSNPGNFFSTGHKNYAAGANTLLDVDGLTKAELLFLDQTKPDGRPLGMAASILLVPNALKVLAALLMASLKLNETTTTDKGKPQDNPHAGKFEVVTSAYLGNASISGSSTKAWYLFADPNRLSAIEVAFLNGIDRPTVERAETDFATLGIQFRGFIDFGVKEQDYRGAVKMKGE